MKSTSCLTLYTWAALALTPACSEWSLWNKEKDPVPGEDPLPDEDGDGYTVGEDCDDANATVHPGVDDPCDEVDNDCDDEVDEDEPPATFYLDQDGDGHGVADPSLVACEQPEGYAQTRDDCQDTLPQVYPGAPESCDGLDNDCDELTDEADATDAAAWYADMDGDGYGDADGAPSTSCTGCPGCVESSDDCDDANGSVSPAAQEACDGLDNDCDGTVDEDDATDAASWYPDADGDGLGDPDLASVVTACSAPDGYTGDASDCDDGDPDMPGDLEYDAEYITVVFDGTTPPPTTDIGGVSIPLASSIPELGAGSYLVPADYDVCYFVANAYGESDIAYAELQTISEAEDAPPVNDRYFGSLQWNLLALQAQDVWACSTGADVTVAVIDSGVSKGAYDGFTHLQEGASCEGVGKQLTALSFTSMDDPVEPGTVYYTRSDGRVVSCTYTTAACTDPCWNLMCSETRATDQCEANGDGQTDDNGHGTHVAGTIAQTADNGLGVAGLAHGASIFPIRAGPGRFGHYDLAASVIEAVSAGSQVINLSIGARNCPSSYARIMEDAITYASDNDVVVVYAAGNDNCDHLEGLKERVSSLPGVIVVGAVQQTDLQSYHYARVEPSTITNMTRSASTGSTCALSYVDSTSTSSIPWGSNHGDGLDLVAPGFSIVQGYDSGEHTCDSRAAGNGATLDAELCVMSGTSMAAPHVSAAIALLLSAGATPEQAEDLLEATAELDPSWSAEEYGHGLINPRSALESLLGRSCTRSAAGTSYRSTPSSCSRATSFSATGLEATGGLTVDADEATRVGDVNGDQRDDVVVFSGLVSDTLDVAVWLSLPTMAGNASPALVESMSADSFTACMVTDARQIMVGDTDGDHASDVVIYCTDGSWWRALATDSDDADELPDELGSWSLWKEDFGEFFETAVWADLYADAPNCDLDWWVTKTWDWDGDGTVDLSATLSWYDSSWSPFLGDVDGDGADDAIMTFFGGWYVAASGECETSSCEWKTSLHRWAGGFGDDDIFYWASDPDPDELQNQIWYQSFVADADGDGYDDFVNLYNDGAWWTLSGSYAAGEHAAGRVPENTGYSAWQDETDVDINSVDLCDQALVGDVDGDGYMDVVGVDLKDGQSIACDMTDIMEAQDMSDVDETCYCPTRTCNDADSDGWRDLSKCDYGWGTTTCNALHVFRGQDADSDGEADLLGDREGWDPGISSAFDDIALADLDGDGVSDLMGRSSSDDTWIAWLAGGLTCTP